MLRYAALLLSFAAGPQLASAQDWALNGIDPVGYRQEGAALPGRPDIVTMWRGQAWHFVSEGNRERFEANPKAFAPGLGGLCVVALSEGRSEPGNPRYFAVIGQRTYLLRSEAARERLLADPQDILMQAKAVWARLHP
ncbi:MULTISPECIES: YHS domain-containing (seleno)protein [Paracoccus]|jgi:hypothetical protein|uniref:YHS domain-containing protein n=1 Tax=Paracoccus litorisediminis TaxID=2006130 RepID=A0A844HHU2_9RHOB|nr:MULTISPECIES: YHS domain-containing (seleno)protein [Paracoccus]MBD9526752.1 hypothetical protein [Paracoccus sp. PAR01]MTH59653.1 hypothetical protein [Paracoccus litorisediminis]